MMKSGELFAGYGGLALAVEAALGAETAWVAEYDEAPSKVLARRFPGTPNLHDVTAVDWSKVQQVDVISGGSPCQDISTAGRARAGMKEGTRSNLWVAMRESIEAIKPKYVVWENVAGASTAYAYSDMEQRTGRMGKRHLSALGRVVGDLTELGYSVIWQTVRASEVGAPHQRARVFVFAWARGTDTSSIRREPWGKRPIPGAQFADNASGLVCCNIPRATGHQGSNTPFGAHQGRVQHWEQVTGIPAPAPVVLSYKGKPQHSPYFSEWLMGLPLGWVTSPLIGLTRREQLKVLGNGVVPLQAYVALTNMIEQVKRVKE